MKKRLFKFLFALVVIGGFSYYWVYDHTVNFMYVNPYTETAGMKKISKTVRALEKALDGAKHLASIAGYDFDYAYTNAYGSGFLKYNPIPNDLDYEVFIDLGTFDYDEVKNKFVLSDQIVSKMDAFQYYLSYYVEKSKNKHFFSVKTPKGMSKTLKSRHHIYVSEIAESLDNALGDKKYVNHLTKMANQDGHIIYYMPYVLQPGRMIIKDYDMVMLYSDMVSYNDNMPEYMRIVSLSLCFCARIKHNGEIKYVEFIPELYSTGPLTAEYRLYAPSVFFRSSAKEYMKNLYSLDDPDEYIKRLLYCYADHLKVVYADDAFEFNPIKIFKRTLQLTDMVSPILGEKESKEIYDFISKNLENRDIQLLNEYINIVDIVGRVFKAGKMYSQFKETGKMSVLIKSLEDVVEELKSRGNVKDEDMKVLEDYLKIDIYNMLKIQSHYDVDEAQKNVQDAKFRHVITPLISKVALYTVSDPDKMHSIIDRLKNIYFDAGFHYMYLYIKDDKNFIVEKDDFTQGIRDFKDFAIKNDLAPDMGFEVLPKEQIPFDYLRYRVWVRYNTTKAQDEYYERIKNILFNNKEQFKIYQKKYFTW